MRDMKGRPQLMSLLKVILTVNRILDIMMMGITNSKEREMNEWADLFKEADPRFKFKGGFKPEGSRLWIIEAIWNPEI